MFPSTNLLSDMFLQSLHPVKSHNEPKLERSESPAERNVPVSVVWDLPLVFVSQVERIHVEGVNYLSV